MHSYFRLFEQVQPTRKNQFTIQEGKYLFWIEVTNTKTMNSDVVSEAFIVDVEYVFTHWYTYFLLKETRFRPELLKLFVFSTF